jgi:hypothetical protein
MRHRPDDVLGTKGRIATEEDVRNRRLQGLFVQHGQAPLVELKAQTGSSTYGILSNQYLAEFSTTPDYSCTLTIGDGEWSYEETTVYEVKSKGITVQHTDRNTLRKVG